MKVTYSVMQKGKEHEVTIYIDGKYEGHKVFDIEQEAYRRGRKQCKEIQEYHDLVLCM